MGDGDKFNALLGLEMAAAVVSETDTGPALGDLATTCACCCALELLWLTAGDDALIPRFGEVTLDKPGLAWGRAWIPLSDGERVCDATPDGVATFLPVPVSSLMVALAYVCRLGFNCGDEAQGMLLSTSECVDGSMLFGDLIIEVRGESGGMPDGPHAACIPVFGDRIALAGAVAVLVAAIPGLFCV